MLKSQDRPCSQNIPLLPGSSAWRWIKGGKQELTFGAILAFPARVADFFPSVPTGEVAKSIISGSTEDRAALPVVMFVTHEAVGVLEVCSAAAVQVLRPLLAHRQVPLCGQAADESFWVFCRERMTPLALTENPGAWGPGGAGTVMKEKGPEVLRPEPQAGTRRMRVYKSLFLAETWTQIHTNWGSSSLSFGVWDLFLPVVRSSGESVWRASIIREKVPWKKGGGDLS